MALFLKFHNLSTTNVIAKDTHQISMSGVVREGGGGGEDEFDYITAALDILTISSKTLARLEPDCSSNWTGEE